MEFLEHINSAIQKLILNSPFHETFSEQTAVVYFTDPTCGKEISFTANYIQEGNRMCVIGKKDAIDWKKFNQSALVHMLIKGEKHQGWAEPVSEPGKFFESLNANDKKRIEIIRRMKSSIDSEKDLSASEIKVLISEYRILLITID